MTISPVERKIRAGLPLIRFLQGFLPLSLLNRLNQVGVAKAKLEAGVVRKAVSAEGVSCEWLIPPNCRMDKVLLYFHGGGFIFEQTPLHLAMGAYLAKKLGVRILMVDYPTAPSQPYPAALNACSAAYLWLLGQGISASDIVVAGDSAGGNLAIATLLKLRGENHSLPAAAICLSPVTDLTPEAHRSEGIRDLLLSPKALKRYNQAYLAGNDPHNPLISPVLGDLRGLPPMLIFAGDEEVLREDAIHFAKKAVAAGVNIRLEIYPRMWHVWQLFLSLPEATQSLDGMAEFCAAQLALD